jgi:hypothetical protein
MPSLKPTAGIPRTAGDWTALVKIGSGEYDVLDSDFARLVSLGLVERVAGLPGLTAHGRYTLGFPD